MNLLFKRPTAHKIIREKLTSIDNALDKLLACCSKRGLYAEDDPLVVEVTRKFFDELDCSDINVANTTSQFEKDIMANNLAFILADVLLPGGFKNSIEIVYDHWVKSHIKCPIFFYSGMELSMKDRKLCNEMEAQFFVKPLDLSKLKQIVQIVLGQKLNQ